MAMLSHVVAVCHYSCIFNYPCCLKSVLSMLVLSPLFQGLVVSVPFACLVAPFCLIALEKSTQYRIAPECTAVTLPGAGRQFHSTFPVKIYRASVVFI